MRPSSNSTSRTPSAAPGRWARCSSTTCCPSGSTRPMWPKTARGKYAVMLHRAILGSLERFIGMMIESYAGKMPMWLAPTQVVVATIVSDADDYAQKLVKQLQRCRHPRRARRAQREDQLQGARALGAEGAADVRGRQARGRGGHRFGPPPRQRRPEGDPGDATRSSS